MTGGADPSPTRPDEARPDQHMSQNLDQRADQRADQSLGPVPPPVEQRVPRDGESPRTWSASTPHRRAPATLFRFLPDGLLVLAPDAAAPIFVTGAACDVWRLAEDAVTFDDVVAVLAQRYQTSSSVVAADLEPVWDRLVDLHAVVGS